MAESEQLLEVLKEIRDELRAVRTELGARGSRMAMSGVRTERVAGQDRWRSAALVAGAAAGLALVIGLVMRDRPAPSPVAVAPQTAATPVVNSGTPPSMSGPSASPAPAPAVQAAPVVARAAVPAAKPPVAAQPPATRQAARWPAGAPAPVAPAATRTIASVPAPAKKRIKPDVAARPPGEVASDEDEPLAFPPPPRRVRVHRLSYGPVESEPAKL